MADKTTEKIRVKLTKSQNRLLQQSLKKLLGPGLLEAMPAQSEYDRKSEFLREAMNSAGLHQEFLS